MENVCLPKGSLETNNLTVLSGASLGFSQKPQKTTMLHAENLVEQNTSCSLCLVNIMDHYVWQR